VYGHTVPNNLLGKPAGQGWNSQVNTLQVQVVTKGVAGANIDMIGLWPDASAPKAGSPAHDRAFWDSVKDSRSADELKAYLEQFPNGMFATPNGNTIEQTLGCAMAEGRDWHFDIVEEILVKLITLHPAYRLKEVPFYFEKRKAGKTKRNLLTFALGYFVTLLRLMKLKREAKKAARE
jgi:hypothetical protein